MEMTYKSTFFFGMQDMNSPRITRIYTKKTCNMLNVISNPSKLCEIPPMLLKYDIRLI